MAVVQKSLMPEGVLPRGNNPENCRTGSAANCSQVIASKLTASKVEIPHFYLTIDCATGNMKDMVKALNAAAKDGEYKISINDFIVKAAALACKQVLCAL